MFTYKRIIKSGELIEIEYYRSIKKIGKYYGGRCSKRSVSPAKQKALNQIRAEKNMQRLMLCNFNKGDWWARFSAPFGTFTCEEEFRAEVGRWFKRIRYRCKKLKIDFKYIAFIECGKLGKNWHIHIMLNEEVRKIAQECWIFEKGMNFTPLYKQGNFEQLASYIRKDVHGQKRIMTSRNLKKPDISIIEAKRREIRKLENGEMIKVPDGYFLLKDDNNYNYNEVTGATWYFAFLPIEGKAFQKIKKGIF